MVWYTIRAYVCSLIHFFFVGAFFVIFLAGDLSSWVGPVVWLSPGIDGWLCPEL